MKRNKISGLTLILLVNTALCLYNASATETVNRCTKETAMPRSPWTSITVYPPTDELRGRGIDLTADVTYKGEIKITRVRYLKQSRQIQLPDNVHLTNDRAIADLAGRITDCISAAVPDGVPWQTNEGATEPIKITHALPYPSSMWKSPLIPNALFYYQVHIDGILRIEEVAIGADGSVSLPVEQRQDVIHPSLELSPQFAQEFNVSLGTLSALRSTSELSPLKPRTVIFNPPRDKNQGLGSFEIVLNNGVKISDIHLLDFKGLPPVFVYPYHVNHNFRSERRRTDRVRSIFEPSIALRAVLEPEMAKLYRDYQRNPNGVHRKADYSTGALPISVRDIVLAKGDRDILAYASLTLNGELRLNALKIRTNGELELPLRDKKDPRHSLFLESLQLNHIKREILSALRLAF